MEGGGSGGGGSTEIKEETEVTVKKAPRDEAMVEKARSASGRGSCGSGRGSESVTKAMEVVAET